MVTGQEFFRALVQSLKKGLGVRYSFAAECLPNDRARSLAAWFSGEDTTAFESDVQIALCLKVLEGRTCLFDRELQKQFPEGKPLVEVSAESYLGVLMRDAKGAVIGRLVVMDDKPMTRGPLMISVMETFASRAAVELERMRAYEHLRRQFQESEERFRDLFEEAPIAYVNEGLDSKFIRANRAAIKTLGTQPEDVPNTYGKSFIPDICVFLCAGLRLRRIGRLWSVDFWYSDFFQVSEIGFRNSASVHQQHAVEALHAGGRGVGKGDGARCGHGICTELRPGRRVERVLVFQTIGTAVDGAGTEDDVIPGTRDPDLDLAGDEDGEGAADRLFWCAEIGNGEGDLVCGRSGGRIRHPCEQSGEGIEGRVGGCAAVEGVGQGLGREVAVGRAGGERNRFARRDDEVRDGRELGR